MGITLKKELIQNIINTLKQLNVNGYDSMEKTVSVVSLLENILLQAEELARKQETEKEKAGIEAIPQEDVS